MRKKQRFNERYSVETDERNFILVASYETLEGKSKTDNVGYFSTLESLRAYTVQHLIKVHGLNALEDVKFKIEALFREYTKNKPHLKIG